MEGKRNCLCFLRISSLVIDVGPVQSNSQQGDICCLYSNGFATTENVNFVANGLLTTEKGKKLLRICANENNGFFIPKAGAPRSVFFGSLAGLRDLARCRQRRNRRSLTSISTPTHEACVGDPGSATAESVASLTRFGMTNQ